MDYVSKDDIIAFINNEINFIQGNSQTYEIILYKDFIGSPLNLNQPTLFNVAIYIEDKKVLQYSKPQIAGVSIPLLVDTVGDTGSISFEIDETTSLNFGAGRIYAQVSVYYENYYPKPKSYIFPRFAIGEVIDNGNSGSTDPEPGTPNNNNNSTSTSPNIPEFTIEHIDGTFPSEAGRASLDSFTPSAVSSIILKNLDKKDIRISSLENFLIKRISVDNISGILTIKDTAATNLYAIYKIVSWQRLDFTGSNGLTEDADGIKINLEIEAVSTGPGVTQGTWQVGQTITYEIDAHGSSKSIDVNGVLTHTDTNINPTKTNGDSEPTGILMSHTPYRDSHVIVEINGISVSVGDGHKNEDSYFSGNSGVTAVPLNDIRSDDELYWNGSSAGYDLEVGDTINLIYEARSADLN